MCHLQQISTNMIHGGIAHNTIPELCEFIFEFRNLPEVQPQSIIEKIHRHIEEDFLPQMRSEKNTRMLKLINCLRHPRLNRWKKQLLQNWRVRLAMIMKK